MARSHRDFRAIGFKRKFMWRWQPFVGVLIGLVAGVAILAVTGGLQRKWPPSGPILSECDGHLQELVIHYEPSAKEIVTTVYRDFLGALPEDVLVHVICPDQAAYQEFAAAFSGVKCRISPVIAGHPMTTWSRDRWVALAPAGGATTTTLWCPREETAGEIWPARAGDLRVAMDLAAAIPSVVARRSNLAFDGGDFLADSDNVFVISRVLPRNLQQTVANREQLLRILAAEFKRRVILLDESPDHHAGMFMASVGDRTMLVGDPLLGRPFVPPTAASGDRGATDNWMHLPGGPDFSGQTQHLFDAVARQCAAAGYRVVRVPTVPASDGRTYLTYVNCLIDREQGRPIVYLPFYRGAESLNAAARAVWESLGYAVRPVDCTAAYRQFGCLHCLVNVLSRS
jgi:hypothetical protein